MKKIIIPLLILFTISNNLYSQGVCGTYDGYLEDEKLKYPTFYNNLEEKNKILHAECEKLVSGISSKQNLGETKIIPVVVHIIHDFGSENVTDEDVQYAIDQLNKNINRQSDNLLTTPPVFAAVSGSANVEFRLAKVDPDTNATNGIVRIQSDLTDVPSPRDIVKSLSYWNSYQYFNIWVVRSLPDSDGNTLLGYAQFPWSGSMSTDGVAIRSDEFKDGHTLTHEVGHWLGLRHTWGDALCGDDGVMDTPTAKEENWGVQLSDFPHNLNVCVADSINPAGEMFVNYMDYSPDQVTSMFTDGQMEIVNQTLEGDEENYPFRKFLWSNENVTFTGTADGYVGENCIKTVDFTENYDNYYNCLGESSVFKSNKNIFSNISSLTWQFGDGNTSSVNSPQHVYSNDGSYDVTLTIEYLDNVIVKAYSMDDISPGYSNIETIVETKYIEGSESEVNSYNLLYPAELFLDDSNYSVDLDTLLYRGQYEETYYLAHYESSCISSVTKENFITILSDVSENNNNSYKYSFESGSITDDLNLINNNLVADWDFNVSANPHWELISNSNCSDGNSCMMLNGKKLTSANPVIFETQTFDLSDLNNPAISFDYIGAAVNSFPTNDLIIYYSKECGVWKELHTLSAEEISSAGYYQDNFIPNSSVVWNNLTTYDKIGSNDLKSQNIRFKFEYNVSSLTNRFYIDNIEIGELSDLELNSEINNRLGFSIYPNPSKDKSNFIFDISHESDVQLKVYNVLGKEVALLLKDNLSSGIHSLELDISKLESGLYFVSLIQNGIILETNSMIVE
tara:strand:+ start:17952 stop:20330 length:2379 start_codon:yes stop_codon:yes gene_type:complete